MNIFTFFDIDNTFIQSSKGHVEALLLSIAEVYGLDASIEVINHHGMTDQEIITRLLVEYGIDSAPIKSGLKDCMENMSRKYAKIVNSEKIDVMEGVFTAEQLKAAGAQIVFHDLTGADEILKILLKTGPPID